MQLNRAVSTYVVRETLYMVACGYVYWDGRVAGVVGHVEFAAGLFLEFLNVITEERSVNVTWWGYTPIP